MLGGLHHVRHRSQYATDFGEYSGELSSADWTKTGGTSASYSVGTSALSISGRSVLVEQIDTNVWHALAWNRIGNVDGFEVLALFYMVDLPGSVGGGGITWFDSNKDGYDATFTNANTDALSDEAHIGEFNNGLFGSEKADMGVTLDTVNGFWIRYTKNGTTLGIKTWKVGDAEPAAFETGVDATYTTARALGLQTVSATKYRCAWFSYAPTGKTAPFPQG